MPTLSRPAYRTRQLLGALRPQVSAAEREEAAAALGEQLMPLFLSMTRRDQRHCLDVYRALLAGDCRDKHVLTAALLHDSGKGDLAGERIRLWQRVVYVLLAAGAPALLERLSTGRGGLAGLHHHSERGALLAEAQGAPAEVVELIRHHEDRTTQDERLRLLRAADDSC